MKPFLYLSEASLQTIQTVLKSRIAKGFKAEDLSFLIGRNEFYIGNTECCGNPPYNEQDVRMISAALNKPITYLEDAETGQALLKVCLERHLYESRYYHMCTCYSDTGKEYMRFIFTEDLNLKKPALQNVHQTQDQKLQVMGKINEMICNGYFDQAKWPYQIYQYLSSQSGLSVNLQSLKKMLNDFCKDDGTFGLKKQFENGHYQYIVNAAPYRSIF